MNKPYSFEIGPIEGFCLLDDEIECWRAFIQEAVSKGLNPGDWRDKVKMEALQDRISDLELEFSTEQADRLKAQKKVAKLERKMEEREKPFWWCSSCGEIPAADVISGEHRICHCDATLIDRFSKEKSNEQD